MKRVALLPLGLVAVGLAAAAFAQDATTPRVIPNPPPSVAGPVVGQPPSVAPADTARRHAGLS